MENKSNFKDFFELKVINLYLCMSSKFKQRMFMKKYIFYLQILFALQLSAVNLENLPYPYNEAKLMPYKPDGWYAIKCRLNLERFIQTRNIKTLVEIGSWMGQSTLHMATILPDDGRLYAVDTWLGSPNEMDRHSKEVLETLYDQFLSNVIHDELTHKIIPVRMESLEAAKIMREIVEDREIDLIYLDATHTYEAAYQDLMHWFPYVKGHGLFCGDDWSWGGGSVGRAVTQFAQENHLTIKRDGGGFWWLEE